MKDKRRERVTAMPPDKLDHYFTPERLARIDKAEADIKAGNFFTSEQAGEELAKRRAQWLRTNRG
jgi:predicted transcriptional regulator